MGLQNYISALKLAANVLSFSGGNSSISEAERYPLVCYLASKDERIFSSFRQNRFYTRVLEHVTREQGRQYLDLISEYGLLTPEDWLNFCRNDSYGSPVQFSYSISGMSLIISPTTIRYAKVLCDIMTMFDTGSIKSIAEIGIGYGGQCRLIRSKIPEAVYTLVDLPEVIGLAEKYLTRYEECRKNIRYVDGGHIYTDDSYDFVMSNYAFSELRRDIQDIYLDKIILKSKRGYITYNPLSHDSLDGYSDDELIAKIPGASRIDEKPLTCEGNCIIVWGMKH